MNKILPVLLILLCLAFESMSSECIKTLNINNDDNPWSGMTGSWEEEEANKNIKALSINNHNFTPFSHLEKYQINYNNLIAKHKHKKLVAVEEEYFSDLVKTKAMFLNIDEVVVIGKIKPFILEHLSPQDLILFLLEAQIIETYLHLEATLCLYKEENNPDIYTAYFNGEHIYYTNEKNVDSLSFSISIDKNTGEIMLTGI